MSDHPHGKETAPNTQPDPSLTQLRAATTRPVIGYQEGAGAPACHLLRQLQRAMWSPRRLFLQARHSLRADCAGENVEPVCKNGVDRCLSGMAEVMQSTRCLKATPALADPLRPGQAHTEPCVSACSRFSCHLLTVPPAKDHLFSVITINRRPAF